MILFCTVLNAVKVNLSEGCLLFNNFSYMCGRDGGQGGRMPIHIFAV